MAWFVVASAEGDTTFPWGEPMAVLFHRNILYRGKPCTRHPSYRGSQGYTKSESARTPLPTISSTTELRTAATPISRLICIYIQLGVSCCLDPVLFWIVIF